MTKFEGGLEIKKLDSVESIEAEIKMLQSKLEFYKELEKTKTPAEEAYKRLYGSYPMTDVGDGYWEIFQAGYNAAQEDYKVGEYQKAKPPETLYNLIADWWDEVFTEQSSINDLMDIIENWLPKEHDTNSYKWNECIKMIKSKLR